MTGTGDVFDQIRAATAEVATRAQFVRLVETEIAPYAASLTAGGFPELTYDTAHHAFGSDADTVAFQFALDTVNFGSGYFPHLRKRSGMSGYYTVASSLRDRWEREGPLTGADLRAIGPHDCAAMFGQTGNEGPAQELMTLFAQAFNDLGVWLGRRYDDDPLGPIADADHSAARLVDLVSEMPLYRDVASYHGMEIPLYKRAQILVTDLAIAFAERGPGAFHDLDRLTIFADNLVPHVLRVDGLLVYDPELLQRIERGGLIAAGSPEEIEIRAVSVHAVERLVAALQTSGMRATARLLDYVLWNRGADEVYKTLPR
ncbi:MAG: hypothetical protein H0T18_05080, partial [Chloroflexia bacterium]|nr:hypothetical protein [Chloroflexia bacterium]